MNEDVQTKLQEIRNHPAFVPSVVGVAAFAVGLGAGYFLGKRQTETVYEETEKYEVDFDFDASKLNEVIESIKEEHNDEEDVEVEVRAEAPNPLPEDVADAARSFVEAKLQEALEGNQGSPEVEEEEVVIGVITQNVFAEDDDDWDYEAELKKRTNTEPYILHRDEFFEEEVGYHQSTLTYYAGDDILVDEDDSPIYNHASVTGPLKFGHGSGDPNVFYVRNDKRRAEYEILKHEGLYSTEVLGLDIEDNMRVRNKRERDLKHSDRKFRME